MIKSYKIEVDCAFCASKIENEIQKIEGVNNCNINFMTQKMLIDIDDAIFDDTLKKAIKVAKKVESDFDIEL